MLSCLHWMVRRLGRCTGKQRALRKERPQLNWHCSEGSPLNGVLRPPSLAGVPVDRWGRKETVLAYWGIGLYWGRAVSNNKKGHLIGHIKVGGCGNCRNFHI